MYVWILLPIIAAIIGWFTNYLAVKLLFHPREPVKIGFFVLQGVFPKRQGVLAEKIGKMVAEELLSIQDIKERVASPENIELINKGIEGKLDHYLTNTFPQRFPLMAFFVSEKIKDKLKSEIIGEVDRLAPEVIEEVVLNIENSLDIEETIREKIKLFSPIKLEDLINSILKKEFKFIELIGAVLGFIIGLVQVAIVHLLQ